MKNKFMYIAVILVLSLAFFAYKYSEETESDPQETWEFTPKTEPQISDKPKGNLMSVNELIFQPETSYDEQIPHFDDAPLGFGSNLYITDSRTAMTSQMFDFEKLMAEDLHINNDGQPKVLIFHTHSSEMFADSLPGQGIVGIGGLLAEELTNTYGLITIHDLGRYDVVDGVTNINGAYERMEPSVRKILEKYPSIEVVIDLHRDGVREGVRLVTDIDGQSVAQIMFFNGLSLLNDKGVLKPITSLPNPNLQTNLALSLRLKTTADRLYPGLSRKIYLNAYRYSLHLLPKTMLVELGAQTNTEQEARNAVKPLARIIYNSVVQ